MRINLNFLYKISNYTLLFFITYCTKSLARWLALRTIQSLLFSNKSSSFFCICYIVELPLTQQTHTTKELLWLIYHILYHSTITYLIFLFAHLRFAVCFHYLLQATFISGGSLWTTKTSILGAWECHQQKKIFLRGYPHSYMKLCR